jgi:hypothetical protein
MIVNEKFRGVVKEIIKYNGNCCAIDAINTDCGQCPFEKYSSFETRDRDTCFQHNNLRRAKTYVAKLDKAKENKEAE